jgi:acetyltransferase-like isoleucine patch superfamily enzyme
MPPLIRRYILNLIVGKYPKTSYIDYKVYMRYPKKVIIGEYTTINRGATLIGSYYNKNTEIRIGNNVAIGPYCTFYSAGHDYRYLNLPDIAQSIIIEDNVWIGGRTVILPGVRLGEGCIIGAGSIVTKDVSPWCVAVGNPAKVINKRKIIND